MPYCFGEILYLSTRNNLKAILLQDMKKGQEKKFRVAVI